MKGSSTRTAVTAVVIAATFAGVMRPLAGCGSPCHSLLRPPMRHSTTIAVNLIVVFQ
jgi:hypothetical protein